MLRGCIQGRALRESKELVGSVKGNMGYKEKEEMMSAKLLVGLGFCVLRKKSRFIVF